ncbi:hypothetical protein AWN76_006150 [Rhodothermaceae bacterium RA]|nr:hypothetical protein AWN76_006150 [Rhodothermaceae bacterium RA]
MDTLVPYAIMAVLALVGLGLLAIVIFGLRNIAFGKVSPASIAIGTVPALLLIVLGFATGDWDWAAIVTVLVTAGLAILALLMSSIRGLFT